MSAVQPLAARDLQRIVGGGGRVLDALTRRVAVGDADMAFDLYQFADAPLLDAIGRATSRGRSLEVLADARLPGGGMASDLAARAEQSGGSLTTYGADVAADVWQHAKTYHLRSAAGNETWVTNLAPIPDTRRRTELALVLRGDAADAAHAVSRAARTGRLDGMAASIDAAAGAGYLVNDPIARRTRLTDGILELLDEPASGRRDLLVITKGIQDQGATEAIVSAHRAGRDVRVLVRDIAEADARRLVDAGVPAWQVGGGLKPRVNAFLSGDRAVVSSAFLWGNMLGRGTTATARDAGVLLNGAAARAVRAAAEDSVASLTARVPLADLLERGALPAAI